MECNLSIQRLTALIVLFALSAVGCQAASPPTAHGTSQPTWQVAFSPSGGATQLVVDTLAHAQQTILVQAYSFTSAPIAQALVEAKRRGVTVKVILDKSQRTEHYSEADFLVHAGIPVSIDAAHSIAHNKVMVIDDETVITGSFNFTKAAEEHNAENVLVIYDKTLTDQYTKNWNKHHSHAELYLR